MPRLLGLIKGGGERHNVASLALLIDHMEINT